MHRRLTVLIGTAAFLLSPALGAGRSRNEYSPPPASASRATQFDPSTARPLTNRQATAKAATTASGACPQDNDSTKSCPMSAASFLSASPETQLAAARKQVQNSHCEKEFNSWLGRKEVLYLSAGAETTLARTTRKKWERQITDACWKLATEGNAIAQSHLGDLYEIISKAGGGATAAKKAVAWYQKASLQGLAEASDSLGDMYEEGWGVRANEKSATSWYKRAANEGDAYAMLQLGNANFYGRGATKDYAAARKWYLDAVKAGTQAALAAHPLATIYLNGWGTKKNYSEALKWYLKAYQFDSTVKATKWARMDAAWVGTIYYSGGYGVNKNYSRALEWFKVELATLPANSDVRALFESYIGDMYHSGGYGLKRNPGLSLTWWRKAATHKSPDAMFDLGVAYADGQGVPASGAAAADWFYKAGVAYLKAGDRDNALTALQNIRVLQRQYGSALPNGFLADRLLAKIYGNGQSASSSAKVPAKRVQTTYEGTGWPVAGGYVVTNHHVIAGRQSITVVTPGGKTMKAKVAVDDPRNDLVLLKVGEPQDLPPSLPIASGPAAIGERVFTIGYPHPDLMGTSAKLTNGTVSSLLGPDNDPRLYQISVPLQSGNSGGPLLDMDGAVVGIVAAKLDAAKVFQWTGDIPENVNYAIKVSYLTALLQSVAPIRKRDALPERRASLEQLDKRVADSILMIIAR